MYSPKIKEKYIPELYLLKLRTGKPMTRMVNEAVAEYLIKVNTPVIKNSRKIKQIIKGIQ